MITYILDYHTGINAMSLRHSRPFMFDQIHNKKPACERRLLYHPCLHDYQIKKRVLVRDYWLYSLVVIPVWTPERQQLPLDLNKGIP